MFLGGLHIAERGVAERLRALVRGALPWPAIDVEKALPWVEKKTGKMLAASQRAALDAVLRSKAMVITGGPGVGKTTLLDAIFRILAAKGTKILPAAPTGRAAKRMTEQSGIEANSIHRLLEIDPTTGGFRRGADNPLGCDLLVMDETRLVDISLMFSLVKAIPVRAALLLVGDVDQLPSVGPGEVLGDIINSGAIPAGRLTEVFRQAAESWIVVNAHRINRGGMPVWPKRGEDSDFWFVEVDDRDKGPRPNSRNSGSVPDAARRARSAVAQRRFAKSHQHQSAREDREIRVDFRAWRQDSADRARLRSRCLRWRPWNRAAHRLA